MHGSATQKYLKFPTEAICLCGCACRYGGQTLGGVETLSRRSLYLEEAVGYFPEEARKLSELHPLEQTSRPGEAAIQVSEWQQSTLLVCLSFVQRAGALITTVIECYLRC